jgi:hypothetical protein
MSRELDRVVSVRFDDGLLAEIRKLAAEDRQSVSDWIRNAVWWEKWRRDALTRGEQPSAPRPVPSTFACMHLSIGNVMSASCGVCGPLGRAA